MAGVPKRLTEMQQRFAQLLVTNEGRKHLQNVLSKLAMKKTAHMSEHQNLVTHKISIGCKYIGEIREEYQKKYEVTYERHISELGKIREAALKKVLSQLLTMLK